jgi:lipopolysaccharide transport system ATP-binding protein
MSSDVCAIRARTLSKRYRIGPRSRYKTLRDSFGRAMASVFAAARQAGNESENTFWALKDVSFDVTLGQVVGLVGRNGAGKSTLLKILSRITEPTSGSAEIRGRVGSLLEVGTGFHPELSGRENVFLNGSLIGMRKAEIRRRFDEIVAFAEVERFLDMPVKHYSSGMYMRLAFAVAAHLDTEILLVDEVLAVGDAAFQRRCLGKMGDVARAGRTVLLVSHNMDAVRRLCGRTLWLRDGQVASDGDTPHVLSAYLLSDVEETNCVCFDPPRPLSGDIAIRLRRVELGRAESGDGVFSRTDDLRITIEWESFAPLYKPRIGFVLQTASGTDVLTGFDASAWAVDMLPPGRRVSSCKLPAGLLNEGEYVIDLGADSPKAPDGTVYPFMSSRTGPLLRFEVHDDRTVRGKYYGEEGFRDARWPGVLLLDLEWTQRELEEAYAPTVNAATRHG